MNRLPLSKRAQVIHMLVEGSSLRSVSRIADVHIDTITEVLRKVGAAAEYYQYATLRKLPCKTVQVDEIWSFCYAKNHNVAKAKAAPEGAGDCWTWTSLCADTKLVPCWYVGDRDNVTARAFIKDLASRMAGRIQLTSDGFKAYENAVESAFGANVDFAMLVKSYEKKGRGRYQQFTGSAKRAVSGNPDPDKISTCFVERQNLTMRMGIRRFTRKSNGFSKKVENHAYAVALHFMFYNFARIHKTLGVTPAMEAGVSDHVWSIEEIVDLAYKKEASKPRGAYGRKKLTQNLISN